MKTFLNNDFFLKTSTAKTLYHEYASRMPIIDFHCHLPPQEIADDIRFENITQAWLKGDHYKWRAMRAHGIPEEYITGNKTDFEKFEKWAECVPYTMRNPLYHWTHLELKRYFGVSELLSPQTAKKIYDDCSAKLQSKEYSVRNLMRMMHVEFTGTTDDPCDDLLHHRKIKNDNFEIKVHPTFRPDKAMAAEDVPELNKYIDAIAQVSGTRVQDFNDYLDALKNRHAFFASNDCSVSDHGLEEVYAEPYTASEIQSIFKKIRSNEPLQQTAVLKFKSCLLYEFAVWDHEKDWVQQYHLGALRKNNSRLLGSLGPDTGFDSMGDFSQGKSLSRFLDKLDADNKLAKTILYNINPRDNELFASMAGNFSDGTVAGKVQYGSAWWFLDQKDGMTRQLNALSNIGLLSRFIGMLTDSRSFLSYPRHEYFRRILCNLFGTDIENGELPNDIKWIGKMVQDICYHNAKNYFNI